MKIRPLAFLLALCVVRAHADPLAELAAFSALKGVDLAKLAAGEVLTGRGPAMTFPRGLAVECAYFVHAPVAKTLELQRQWSPVRSPGLKTYLHSELPAKPTMETFRVLSTAPLNGPIKALIAATEKLDPARPALFLSAEEARGFGRTSAEAWGGSLPSAVSGFWGSLLAARAQAFNAGGVPRQPAYFWKGESISAADEIGRLLKEAPAVRAQFSGLAAALTGGAPAKSVQYWELSEIQGQAALSLGATLEKAGANAAQSADVQYYASSGLFVLVTFYQMWPVEGGTLVWRGDLIASPELGDLHGIERTGAGSAMMRQVKQHVTAFLKDAGQ